MKASSMSSPILACIALAFALSGAAQTPDPSPMGAYRETATFCGREPPPRDAVSVPFVGCFVLDPGHRARGTRATHELEVAVDDAGREGFAMDGASIATGDRASASGTTSPFVRPGGSGYRLCSDRGGADCPATITVFSRNPDRSVLFMVSECLPSTGNPICVTTQANWDYESARRHVSRRVHGGGSGGGNLL